MLKKCMCLLIALIIVVSCVPVVSGAYAEELQVKSITVEPLSLLEGTHLQYYGITDDYGEYQPCKEYYYADIIEYTVELINGDIVTGTGNSFEYNGGTYEIYVFDDQSAYQLWAGGKTYEATARLGDVDTTFSVTIDKSPVVNFEIEPVTYIEGSNSSLSCDYNAETLEWDLDYFHYYLDNLKYTVEFDDGTVEKGTGTSVKYKGEEYEIYIDDPQSYDTRWLAGNTYDIEATVLGASTTFPVTIDASPVESLEIKSLSILEGTNGTIAYNTDDNGEYTLKYFEYFPQSLIEYTVTFTDGKAICGVGDTFVYDGEEYQIDLLYYQSYNEQWTVGNSYEVTATLGGYIEYFDIFIEEFPIKEIDFEPIYISENDNTDRVHFISKDEETGKYKEVLTFWYTNNPKYTITFADGTVMQSGGEYIKYRNVSHMFVPYFDRAIWTTGGVYDSTATFMGGEVPIKVFYDKAKLWGINLAKEPDKTVFEKHECVNPEGAVINVKYSYDTYESVTLGRYNPISSDNNYEYIKGLDNEFSVYVTGKGEYMEMNNRCLISFAGYPEHISAKYKDREVTGVSIREENSGLYMTFVYDDGSDQNLKVFGMEIVDKTVKDSTDKRRGLVITNDGNFIGEFFRNTETGEFYIVMDGVDGAALTSNTLSSCKWWDMQSRYDDIVRAINVYVHNTKSFKGDITSENIDELLSVACNVSGLYDSIDNVCSVTSEGVEFKADLVKSTFFDLFGVMPDLELSNKYDAEKGTVKVRAMGTATSDYEVPYDVEESNGAFTATILWGDSEYKMTLDENLKLIAYGVGENKENTDTTEPSEPVTSPDSSKPSDVEKPSDSTKPSETEIPSDSENTTDTISLLGDVNGDGKVNIKDATMIQKAAAKIIELTDDKKLRADVNTDSKNNVKDATAIQKFVAKIETGFPIGEPIVSKENN